MSDLRKRNQAVQRAEFPSAEFAQAVRDWIGDATERLEPALSEAEDEFISDGFTSACAAIASSPKSAPSEAAKVYYAAPMMGFPCANCGKETLRMDGHVSHRASGDETEYYCDKPAQPEPAVPEMPVCGAPDGTPYEIAEAVEKLTRHGEKQEAHNLAGWWMRWRNSAQPVRMSNALTRVLDCAEMDANRDRMGGHEATAETTMAAIRVVRQQAAQPPRLEKVRELIQYLAEYIAQAPGQEHFTPMVTRRQVTAALAELDAHEGRQ